MARRLPFRQSDLARAVKGARTGGMAVGRVEIDPGGRIVLIAEGERSGRPENALEAWKAKRDARSA